MKRFFLALSLLVGASAFADSIRIDLGRGEYSLPECRGTIEATKSADGRSDQLNLILRSVKECSNFTIETTGKEYKLNDQGNGRGGSYTIPVREFHMGWNQVRLLVASNSGKHKDDIAIWVNVVPGNGGGSGGKYGRCLSAVNKAVKKRFEKDTDKYGTVYSEFDRESNKGNYVYDSEVSYGFFSRMHYEAVTSPSCEVLSVTRK